MALKSQSPVLEGILLVPPQGLLRRLRKKWSKKYCQIFKANRYRTERLEIYNSKDDARLQRRTPTVANLEGCSVRRSEKLYGFILETVVCTVTFDTCSFHFACKSARDMDEWINAFATISGTYYSEPYDAEFNYENGLARQLNDDEENEEFSLPVHNHDEKFVDDDDEGKALRRSKATEDENIYECIEDAMFAVRCIPSKASRRCGLEAKQYTLTLNHINIKLFDNEKLAMAWPYTHIKRYELRKHMLILETTPDSKFGEGLLFFNHENRHSRQIRHSLHVNMNSMWNARISQDETSVAERTHQTVKPSSESSTIPSSKSAKNGIERSQKSIKLMKNFHLVESKLNFQKPPPLIIAAQYSTLPYTKSHPAHENLSVQQFTRLTPVNTVMLRQCNGDVTDVTHM